MNRILVLVILALLSTGGAYYLAIERHSQSDNQTRVLLGGLSESGKNLTKVVIENADGVLFSASRAEDKWLATHMDTVLSFPVDVSALSEFVSALTQAHIVEAKTAKASQYPKLGLEPVTQPGAQSTLITLVSDTQQWRILIGNLATSGLGSYVREPSQQSSYLINQNIQLPLTPFEWLKPDVIDIGLNDLERIVIDNDGAFTLTKSQQGEWELSDNNQPLAYPGVLAHTLNDIVNFEYEKVEVLVVAPDAAQKVRSIRLENASGNSLEMNLYARQEPASGYLMTLTGDLLTTALQDWEYYLSDFQARGLLTKREELLQQPQ